MPLDFPATSEALWSLYDTCGVRPEYVVPVMWVESASDPNRDRVFQQGIQSLAGLDYWGLIQANGKWLRGRGIEPKDIKSWPASREIREVVQPWLCEKVRTYGRLKSGIRVYQSIFYPASLKYAPGLDDHIVDAPAGGCPDINAEPKAFWRDPYCANRLFDADKKGFITPADLGRKLQGGALPAEQVKEALTQLYDWRPAEKMQNPVYGGDFIPGWRPFEQRSAQLADWASVFTILGGAVTAAVMLHKGATS